MRLHVMGMRVHTRKRTRKHTYARIDASNLMETDESLGTLEDHTLVVFEPVCRRHLDVFLRLVCWRVLIDWRGKEILLLQRPGSERIGDVEDGTADHARLSNICAIAQLLPDFRRSASCVHR